MSYWKCFRFLATLVLCDTQLGNYAVNIIKMTLDIWNTPISVKMYVYRNEVKIIAITHFLATLAIVDTKFAITRYLVVVSTWN